jgi:predicted aspartyl protease
MSAGIIEPKPGVDMGRVVVDVIIENAEDRDRLERGEITPGQVRRVTVPALMDTGATFFCLPEPLVRQLGLKFHRTKESRTVSGPMMMKIYREALIEVQGRECSVEVMELPADRQVLLGQLPLETLDFWVDTTARRLVGNPEHGGAWMAEVF